MKLHYNPMSDNCRRVLAVVHHLGLKNVDLQVVDVTKGMHKTPEFLRLNGNGMLPVLEDTGITLWESNAIMQYLCETQGDTTLWPKDTKVRADITRWQFWDAAHFHNTVSTLQWELMFKKMMNLGEANQVVVDRAYEQFNRFANVLNNHLETREYIAGNNITLADFSIAASLTYAPAIKLPLDNYKRIQNWYATRIEKLDAWKKTTPPSFTK
jgi:glutathione S-transferase